jgi:hypothetical protein
MTLVIIAICITLTAFFILIAYLLREGKKTGKFKNETKQQQQLLKILETMRQNRDYVNNMSDSDRLDIVCKNSKS